MSHTINVEAVFAALADPMRRQIMERLANVGNASASALAEELPISRQAIAKHCDVLVDAGLAARRREGKAVTFVWQPAQLAATGRWLQRMAQKSEA